MRKGHCKVAAQSHGVTHQGIALPTAQQCWAVFGGRKRFLWCEGRRKGDPKSGEIPAMAARQRHRAL